MKGEPEGEKKTQHSLQLYPCGDDEPAQRLIKDNDSLHHISSFPTLSKDILTMKIPENKQILAFSLDKPVVRSKSQNTPI